MPTHRTPSVIKSLGGACNDSGAWALLTLAGGLGEEGVTMGARKACWGGEACEQD